MTEKQIIDELLDYTQKRVEEYNVLPFCAFVVKDGSIISRGFNNSAANFGIATMHAEAVAIRKACQSLMSYEDLINYEIYSSCEPCLACFDTCLMVGIKKISYLVGHEDKEAAPFFNSHSFHPADFEKNHPNRIQLKKITDNNQLLKLFIITREKHGF